MAKKSFLLCTLFFIHCSTNPTNPQKSPKELANLYTELGTSALLRGEYPQAVEDLRKAITVDSANAIAHNHLGLAYYSLGKSQLAKEEFNRAVLEDSNYSDAYINLGNFALDEKKPMLAKHYYNKALDNLEYKFRHRALTSLAQLAFHENKLDDARLYLYQSLQANPNYCLTHFLMGMLYIRESNSTKAVESFSKSVSKTCVQNPEGHYQLGLAYLKLKNFDKARHEFVRLIEEFPQTIHAQKAGEYLKDLP